MIIMEVILWKFLSKVRIKSFGGLDYNKFLAESRRGATGKGIVASGKALQDGEEHCCSGKGIARWGKALHDGEGHC